MAALLTLGSSGCAGLPRKPVAPVEVTWHQISETDPARTTLLILLPGRSSRAEDFERKGFLAGIRPVDRIDAVTVDLHLGYYQERTLDVRLREDVLIPARQRGYRRIEMVGISLGGLGALIYDSRFPGEVDRIALLSPYTGEMAMIEEIQQAGGLDRWDPGTVDDGNRDRGIWADWKSRRPGSRESAEIVMGVGSRDRFLDANRFFADEFLDGRLLVVEGGHDWPAWTEIFRRIYLQEAEG